MNIASKYDSTHLIQVATIANEISRASSLSSKNAIQRLVSAVESGELTSDLYLPAHLVQAAQTALMFHDSEACQHAFNALSTAAWHCARGESGKALARMRRAQSHISASMEGVTA